MAVAHYLEIAGQCQGAGAQERVRDDFSAL
jgi:hypothetical protein